MAIKSIVNCNKSMDKWKETVTYASQIPKSKQETSQNKIMQESKR